ncbi:Holliday junction resolvase RuvX [Candidatus Berkelbacteria bacterium]|nr:Holliday junction resolvase RuvX [Candidatus Berkelbacteria bacterium]
MSKLGLDIGEKRVGVAVNPTGELILELPTINYQSLAGLIEQLGLLVDEYRINQIVVGRPRAGGQLAAMLPSLVEKLNGVELIQLNESLTTKEAERQLSAEGRPGDSDARAAKIILEQYLNTQLHD